LWKNATISYFLTQQLALIAMIFYIQDQIHSF